MMNAPTPQTHGEQSPADDAGYYEWLAQETIADLIRVSGFDAARRLVEQEFARNRRRVR